MRCGLFGFSVRGNGARDIVFERDIAVNPGSNGWFVEQKSIYADLISGFSVRRGAEDPTYPRNIAIRDCQSLDDQAVPTMRTGFFTDVEPQAFGITIQNSRSHGHLNSAIVGFDAAGP